jgi:N-acetylmuramoyl-L-alanine amidase
MSKELWVYIQCEELEYYRENSLWGDISHIQYGSFEQQQDGLLLKIGMDRVLEYKTTMDGSVLTIAGVEPHESYEFTVVLDPEGGGSETGFTGEDGLAEKELTLQVAKLVQKKLDLSDVRLYLTRSEDADVSEEDRVWLAEEVKADLYLGIGAEYDGDNPENYGISSSYNDEYYLPGFGNVELADEVTRSVTIAAGNRALGLYSAQEDSILKSVRTVAARISLGCLSNRTESALLSQETYREKLADGIVTAIEEACEALRTQEGAK